MKYSPGVSRSTFEVFCNRMAIQPDYRLTPLEREAFVLCATSAGRTKYEAMGTISTKSPATVTDVLGRLECIGDEQVALSVAEVLAERLPPVLREYLIQRVMFLGVGRSVMGFCGTSHLPIAGRPWLIVLMGQPDDEAALANLIGHESMHAWTLPEPAPDAVAGSAIWQSAWYHADLGIVPPAALETATALREEYARGEIAADALARCLGFGGVS